jgi:hypothetical protein
MKHGVETAAALAPAAGKDGAYLTQNMMQMSNVSAAMSWQQQRQTPSKQE